MLSNTPSIRDSVVFISSSEPDNNSFGTGFVIQFLASQGIVHILTCAHVIEELGGIDKVEVRGREAQIVAVDTYADMAVLQIKGLQRMPPLKISNFAFQGDEVEIHGYGVLDRKNSKYLLRSLHGHLHGQIAIKGREYNAQVDAWDIIIKDDFSGLQRGYSGAPVINSRTGAVIAMASHKLGEQGLQGHAISISMLPEVWKDIPEHLISKENIQDRLPKNPKTNEFFDRNGFFVPPKFSDAIFRKELVEQIEEASKSNSIIAVEGLSGCGKSYIVSAFVNSPSAQQSFKHILWYDAQENDVIENFLSYFETIVPLQANSSLAKCKELISIINQNDVLLIIDNYERVNKDSYHSLIKNAVGYINKGVMILISRVIVDLYYSGSKITHVRVNGFNQNEMRDFLVSRNFQETPPNLIGELLHKTEGLPLAAALFATLVIDFGYEPEYLLDHEMSSITRLKTWFKNIINEIGEQEYKLLKMLSLAIVPFNIGVVKMASIHLNIQSRDVVFENLIRALLIQKYTPYRWNVHTLISIYCRAELTEEESISGHNKFARHYIRGFRLRKNWIIQQDDEFIWKVRACRHYLFAENYYDAGKILTNISRTVKARGYCGLFINLSSKFIYQHNQESLWIEYDHAHCLYIKGQFQKSLNVLEPLLYRISEEKPGLRLAVTRLYAEVIGSLGDPQKGLEILESTISQFNIKELPSSISNHAFSAKIWLLTRLKRYDDGIEMCKSFLEKSKQEKNKLGEAVILTHFGSIEIHLEMYESAYDHLTIATNLFRDIEDSRGLAWSLSKLALSEFTLGFKHNGTRDIIEAMDIMQEFGDYSLDYQDILNQIGSYIVETKSLKLYKSELSRLKGRSS